MGPQRSTETLPKGVEAFIPSLILGTGECVCLPSMQWSHFGGDWDRSIGIPFTTLSRAMLMIVRLLQCPRRRCQVSTSGTMLEYIAEGGGLERATRAEGQLRT